METKAGNIRQHLAQLRSQFGCSVRVEGDRFWIEDPDSEAGNTETTRAPVQYFGVDGCKAGWFYIVAWDDDYAFGLVPALADLFERVSKNDLLLVDIPIGLRDSGGERLCDLEARQRLGKRRSSVFPAPVRAALNTETYEKASAVNFEATGRKLSKQTWAIVPKIREVDKLLAKNELARATVREVHPEVCFWGLSGKRPMGHNKKRHEGFDERLNVLTAHWPRAREAVDRVLSQYRGKGLQPDDVLDALAAMVTAMQPIDMLATLPDEPETDSMGLPMEMVYFLRQDDG